MWNVTQKYVQRMLWDRENERSRAISIMKMSVRQYTVAVTALSFQQQHQLCPIRMGTGRDPGPEGSDEDTNRREGGGVCLQGRQSDGERGKWLCGRGRVEEEERTRERLVRWRKQKDGKKGKQSLCGRVRPMNLFADIQKLHRHRCPQVIIHLEHDTYDPACLHYIIS